MRRGGRKERQVMERRGRARRRERSVNRDPFLRETLLRKGKWGNRSEARVEVTLIEVPQGEG